MSVRRFATWLGLAAIYALAGGLALSHTFVHSSATVLWPPAGIALAAILLLGPQVWPAIFAGAFLVNEAAVGPGGAALLIAAGNTAAALLGARLVNRFAGGRAAFARGRDIFLFVLLAGFVSSAAGAGAGVGALALFGSVEPSALAWTWVTWWLSDAAGVVAIAPPLILWALHPKVRWRAGQWLELAGLFALLVVIALASFVRGYPLPFLCIPVCVWIAGRFGQREATTAVVLLAAIAIGGTSSALPIDDRTPDEVLLLLEAFVGVMSVIGLTIGGAVAGRRAAEAAMRQAQRDLEVRLRTRESELQSAIDSLAQSERRLQTIIDTEPACVKLVSAEGMLLDMNIAGLGMVGAENVSQLIGRPVVDLVHPEDRPKFVEMHQDACAGSPGRLEFRIVGLNGQERWVDAHAVPFDTLAGGEAQTAVLSVTSDVTDRKRLEDQLRQSQKMEAVGLLAGGIAHDFNNLLTAIAGFTQVVYESFDKSDPRREDLEEVAKASRRAAALTRQLLAVSRRQILQPTVLNVNEMIVDLDKLLRRTLPESITFALVLDPLLDSVRADRAQLEQVVMNLAINAGDAMPQGGRMRLATATVDVDEAWARRHPSMPSGRYVRLSVSDSGVGMSPQVQARIFEPFFTTKEHGKGTGLGLATVYGIVKQSDGFIWVESEAGRGTTFDIYLPAVHAPVPRSAQALPVAAMGRGTQTILLAEDDGAVRKLARDILARQGYAVLEARDGEEALKVAREYRAPIDLLLTDVVMPGLSGRDLAEQLTAERPGVRVLYTSGYTEDLMIRAGFRMGLALLPKPFFPLDLLRKVQEVLAPGSVA